MRDDWPATRDIVLIGGGHTHALVLRRWGMDPLPGARLTLVNPGPTAPYTGMLPGFVAGHYDRDELDIDLVRLARFAGARIVLGHATAIDRAAGTIAVEDRFLGPRTIGYDTASLDIGIHSDMPHLPGFADHGLPAKPLDRFATAWAAWRKGDRQGGMAVIGGGVGGAELAMAMSFGAGGAPVTLIERDRALSGLPPRARAHLGRELARNRVTVVDGANVRRVTARGVDLDDGRHIDADLVVGASGARPYGWLDGIGLALTDGYVDVGPSLQTSDPAIFAVGDCAHLTHAPRPKAGVFAVRQAPVLFANLRAAATGRPMRAYRPQRDYLKLISTGRKSAVAVRSGRAARGVPLWHLKDRIDRRFMSRLGDLAPMARPALPREHARGLERHVAQAPCGGCGAKVGRGTLARALAALPQVGRADVEAGAGDDAAILAVGGVRQVLTVDQIRAFCDDPGLMARIAALHALGDCLAMGARPQAALSVLTLPRLSPRLEGRTLEEILAAAGAVFEAAGAPIVGGHSATGPELQAGFTVAGLLDGPGARLSGARPGDALLLTKPLGTGVILAAEMALAARGSEAVAAWAAMATPQDAAAAALAGARAMTDVTGFGLAGHLLGICEASGTGARIALGALPILPGAARLLERGHRSTLHAQNRDAATAMDLAADPLAEILFDPQTAGGLLAAVPPQDAEALLSRLPGTARIGEVVPGPARIRVV